MSRRLIPDSAQPCIWMSAGLLTYKLCDRRFQCDQCPLNAGLCGPNARVSCCQTLQTPGCSAAEFPADRRYTNGHTWIKPLENNGGKRYRFGLDAFAAAILGHCRQVTWRDTRTRFASGAPVCEIDFGLGVISARLPIACHKIQGNPTLLDTPDRLVTDPYNLGWIAELTPCGDDSPEGLLEADPAREKARRDLQWFRRQVALRLLAECGPNGNGSSDHAENSVDLREMLAGPTYLELLPELVH